MAMFAALRYMCGDTYCVAIYVVWRYCMRRYILCGDLCYVMIHIVLQCMPYGNVCCVASHIVLRKLV